MKTKYEQQERSKELRATGLSLTEIAKLVGSSKSSVSLWVREVKLTEEQKNKLMRLNYEKVGKCKNCGKEFSRSRENKKNVYCSRGCNFEFISKKAKKREKKCCLLCGKETIRTFCSSECSLEYDWKTKIEEVKRTGICPQHASTRRLLMIKMKDHKCEICGGTEWMGKPIPLIVDHINGHHEDNRLENLRYVCGNCDMQLPTYKNKNRGNGRKYDREYRNKRNRGKSPDGRGTGPENQQTLETGFVSSNLTLSGLTKSNSLHVASDGNRQICLANSLIDNIYDYF